MSGLINSYLRQEDATYVPAFVQGKREKIPAKERFT